MLSLKDHMLKKWQSIPNRVRDFAISAIFILLVISFLEMQNQFTSSPKFTRQLAEKNYVLRTSWIKNVSLWFQSSNETSNNIYAYTTTGHLLAFNSSTGLILWEKRQPQIETGVRGLLATEHAVITITATNVHAYQTSTGNWIWSTKLGDGHVGIYSQQEGSVISVYYGDRIIELSIDTGKILKDQVNNLAEWIADNTEIRQSTLEEGTGMIGIDRRTGEKVWENWGPVFSRHEWFPIQNIDHSLFVLADEVGICNLNLISGKYEWCRPEEYISNFSLNRTEMTGYALQSNFNLMKIDLITGEVMEETQFLPDVLPERLKNRGFEYSVAVTQDAVVVSFSDSDQTFGLLPP